MAISKVTLNGETLIDVTQDTVAQDNLLTGKTATGADGEKVAGALTIPTFNTQEKTVEPGEEEIEVTPDGLPENYSGSIVTFDDSIGDRELYSLNVNIEPMQSGSDDPSPDNVRPISGWIGAQVMRTEKNLFGGELLRDGVLASIPGATDDPQNRCVKFAASDSQNSAITTPCGLSNKFKPNTAYTFIMTVSKSSGVGSNLRILYTDGSFANIPAVNSAGVKETIVYVTSNKKTVAALRKMNSSGTTTLYYDESGIFEGRLTAEDFEHYQGETYDIAFPTEAGTVYGGALDVLNGTLTVDTICRTIGENYSYIAYSNRNDTAKTVSCIIGSGWNVMSSNIRDIACSHVRTLPTGYSSVSTVPSGAIQIRDDSSHKSCVLSLPRSLWPEITNWSTSAVSGSEVEQLFREYFNEQANNGTPVQIAAKIINTLTYDLPPVNVKTLLGENNIWVDCGDVEVSVPSSTNFYDGMSKVTVGAVHVVKTQEKIVKSGMETIEVTPDGLPENYSGSIVTFDDSIGDRELYSLNVNIEPMQSGSGDPSPSNIRPIHGWTGATIEQRGDNLYDASNPLLAGFLNSDGSTGGTSSNYNKHTYNIPIKGGVTYVYRAKIAPSSDRRSCWYDANGAVVGFFTLERSDTSVTVTAPDNAFFVSLTLYNTTGQEISLSVAGNSSDDFEEYKEVTLPITFTDPTTGDPLTVYGGTLDTVTGTLTVTHGQISSYNGETLPGAWISDRDVYAAGTAPTTGAQVVYELAEPVTYQLTPVDITTLLGVNNIWADCGDVEISVPSSTNFYDGMSKVTVNPADIYDGSLGDGSSEPINIDPWIRPTEWPDYDKLDISDEECMFFTYDSSDRDGLDFAAFGAECTGGFTVERGYLNNGVWTVENTTDVATKGTYSETLPTDRDYTVYKLRPTTSGAHITRIFMGVPATYNGYSVFNSNAANYIRTSQKCIERYGNLPHATQFAGPWGCIFLVSETELSVDSVTNMSQMFASCHNLENLDVSKWNTSNVTNMSGAFSGCVSLKFLDVSKWDTSKVTVMNSMFADCNNLRTIDVSNWNTSGVINMQQLFYNCFNVQELDVSEWDVSNVTNAIGLFNSCRSIKSLEVSKWNTSKFTTLAQTFCYCNKLANIDVSHWNTGAVTTLSQTFSGCANLESVDVSNWDTSLVTTTYQMFYQCYSLKNFIASRWNTERLTSIAQMFYRCDSLQNADIADWDTSGVTDMGSMFSECRSLQFVDTSKWNTSAATKMANMFQSCTNLTYFSMNTAKVYSSMFNYCQAVTAFIFTGDSVPTLESTNAFSNNNFANGQKIKFKPSLVDEAKAATNWSTYAAYIEAI